MATNRRASRRFKSLDSIERDRFEAWVRGRVPTAEFERADDGEYIVRDLQTQWIAWQAAAAAERGSHAPIAWMGYDPGFGWDYSFEPLDEWIEKLPLYACPPRDSERLLQFSDVYTFWEVSAAKETDEQEREKFYRLADGARAAFAKALKEGCCVSDA